MRSIAAIAVGMIAIASPAKAQLAVICPTCASEFQAVAAWGKQGADMVRQLAQMRQQYQMLVSTYNALSHATDISGMTSALGGVTRTYVPEASETLGFVGSASRLFGSGSRHMSADQLFSYQSANTLSRGGAWFERQAGEMQRREMATANAKALAEAGMQDAQARILQLNAAQIRIGMAGDVTEVAAIQAALTASQMNINIHQAQINNMRFALEAENRVERQRGEQMQTLGANQWMENMQASVDALGGD